MSEIKYPASFEIPFEINNTLIAISEEKGISFSDLVYQGIKLFVALDALWEKNHIVYFKKEDCDKENYLTRSNTFDKNTTYSSSDGEKLKITAQIPMSMHFQFKKICFKHEWPYNFAMALAMDFLILALKYEYAGIKLYFRINSNESYELDVIAA